MKYSEHKNILCSVCRASYFIITHSMGVRDAVGLC